MNILAQVPPPTMNPLVPLLIVGMTFAFLICLMLALMVRRSMIHFIESREAADQFGK